MTVLEELKLQTAAERRVLEILSLHKSAVTPERILASSTTDAAQFPDYAVRRAIWSLVVDGKVLLTLENKIRLARR